MPEDSDYTPASWSANTSFSDARAAYDDSAGRSYSEAVHKGTTVSDLVPEKVSSDAAAPIVLVFDVTGSMGTWPAVMFSKFGYFDHEADFYTDHDYEVCVAAIGDSKYDDYSLQVRPFGKGNDVAEALKKLVIEGGGGGNTVESYNLAAVYFANNCNMSKAIRPILIFVGDEGVHELTTADEAKNLCKVDTKEDVDTAKVFEELKRKFEVFIIRKRFDSSENHRINKQWEDYLGADHVANLQDAGRVVDVIFGILAQVTNKVDAFKKELTDRQSKDEDGPEKIEKTLVALNTIHTSTAGPSLKKLPVGSPTVSITRRKKAASKTARSLLDDD
jgi:hypothetical protein